MTLISAVHCRVLESELATQVERGAGIVPAPRLRRIVDDSEGGNSGVFIFAFQYFRL
jgi:hypothetical protein